MAKQKNKSNTPKFLFDLPYIKDIRASWIANQSHCDPSSSSKRQHYIKKGIEMSPVWMGEIGFLRYYLWHIDCGYIPGKSKLQRKDQNKGFSPENCLVLHTTESKNNNSVKKPAKAKIQAKQTMLPTEVTNNNIFIIDRNVDIADLINGLYLQSGKTNKALKKA